MPRKQGDSYLGNPLIKGPNVQVQYTNEELAEYVRCSKDPIHFLETYMKIVSLDQGPIVFKMYPFQKRIVKAIHSNRFVISKIPRQSGKSTVMLGYILHSILFIPNYKVAILANKLKTASELLSRLKFAYENLPKWMQQGVIEWNKLSFTLENGSKVVSAATSASAVRGDSFNFLLLDEFAHIPENIAQEFFSSVYPTISSGKTSKVVIVSTPRGMNMFYKLWKDAEAGRNQYIPIEAKWSEVPGRDSKWKEITRKSLSNERLWYQEYECEFLGSEDTLIKASKISSLAHEQPIFQNEEGLIVYKAPIKNHIYAMCVDTSRGQGQDYHAVTVVDATQMPYEVVARFRNNVMPVMIFPNLIEVLGNRYNEAYALIELNDTGQQVSDILREELEYENIINITVKGKKGQKAGEGFGTGRVQYGIKMSNQTKKTGCLVLKEMIEHDKILLNDFDIIAELSTYVAKGVSYEASPGYNDDLISTLVMFGWLTTQPYFKDIVNTDIRRKLFEDKLKKLEEDLVPFGFLEIGEDSERTQDEIDLGREMTPKQERLQQNSPFNDEPFYGGANW